MKIKSVRVSRFKRFHNLSIPDLPPARLFIMAGPNGSGKSSLFDAFAAWQQSQHWGVNWDQKYYARDKEITGWQNQCQITFHEGAQFSKKSMYLRTAYRNDPDFELKALQRQGDPSETLRVRRMIETDGAVAQNYQRLASNAFEDAFDRASDDITIRQFRENTIGEIRDAVKRLFPSLELNTLGNPLVEGTFRFTKGKVNAFNYKNLSGGEKSAFDLLLDMVVKRRTFDDTVFAIDEPEAHINTRLQGVLLQELYDLIPDGSQMWVATHSIGMMRKAREIHDSNPGQVIFLDFENHDFDTDVVLNPVAPTRSFWERVLKVALDDLADLVAPKELVICEGNPSGPVAGKNAEHDARCFEAVFGEMRPDTKFISAGNSHDVAGDRLRFAAVFPNVIKGIEVRRVIDRDDHSSADVAQYKSTGVRVLRRRNLEAYLYDNEVLGALFALHGRTADFPTLLLTKEKAMKDSVSRGNPQDDLKSAAPEIYSAIKRDLSLTACGNNQMAFARAILAPLIKPEMRVYADLYEDIFGA